MKRLLFSTLFVLAFFAAHTVAAADIRASAPTDIEVYVNGGYSNAASLRAAIEASNVPLGEITRLEITGGSVTTDDWNYLKDNSNALSKLVEFVVFGNDIVSVADIPDCTESEPLFRAVKEVSIYHLKKVGKYAFRNAANLVEVHLPAVTTIDEYAFAGCTSLQSISLPELTALRKAAFQGCASLAMAEFPKCTMFVSAADRVFSGNTSLKLLVLNKALKYTGAYSVNSNNFTDCPTPRFLQLVDDAGKPLAYNAAEYGLMKAHNDGNTSDSRWYGWFLGPTISLEVSGRGVTVTIPSAQNHTSLQSAIESVTTNGSRAKENLTLASIQSVKVTQGRFTPADWRYLKQLTGLQTLEITNDVSFVAPHPRVEYNTNVFPSSVKTLVLNKLHRVGQLAFHDLTQLDSVSLPHAKSVGANAFYNCSALTGVDMPEVLSVGSQAFDGCAQLAVANMPEVLEIDEFAFWRTALLRLDLPKVTRVGEHCFRACGNLLSANMPEVTRIEEMAFDECRAMSYVHMPKVTHIGDGAFNNNLELRLSSDQLPAVLEVGMNAFCNCYKLTAVDMPLATTIGAGAFSGDTLITSVNLPRASVIGKGAFEQCKHLQSVSLPRLTAVSPRLFNRCHALRQVCLPLATSIGVDAFSGDSLLSVLMLGATPPTVATPSGKWEEDAFAGCPATRYLYIVDKHGKVLTNSALSDAIYDYEADEGFSFADGLWRGFTFAQPCMVTTDARDGYINLELSQPVDAGAHLYATFDPTISFTLKPYPGYAIGYVEAFRTGEPAEVLSLQRTGDTYSFARPAYDVTIVARFVQQLQVGVASAGNGMVSGGGIYLRDSVVTVSAVANSGYHFVRWVEGGATVSTDNPYTFSVTSNRNLVAEFEEIIYTLTYTVGKGGSISGQATQTVQHGQSGTEVEAVPSEGYRFVRWSDGVTTAKRTDTNVQANLNVTAEFEKSAATGLFDAKLDALSVFPNPTAGQLWVSVPELAEGTAAEVLVYNANGQLLQRVPAHGASAGSAASRLSIDLSGYPAGVYIIRVGNAMAKVIKQ